MTIKNRNQSSFIIYQLSTKSLTGNAKISLYLCLNIYLFENMYKMPYTCFLQCLFNVNVLKINPTNYVY